MAKYDGGKRVKVKYANGFISYLGEKAAKILMERKNEDGEQTLKILGDAPQKKEEPKGKK